MMRVLKWLGMILVLPALWLGLVLTEWLPRPAASDAAVIAALKAPSPSVDGRRNVFAGLQSFGFEVPESEWDAVAAAGVALANLAYDKPDEIFGATKSKPAAALNITQRWQYSSSIPPRPANTDNSRNA